MKCYCHPENEAAATCAECGKAICQDCAASVGGRFYCRTCLATTNAPAQITAVPAIPTNKMALTSMLTGLGSWLIWLIVACSSFTIGMATLGLALACLAPLGLMPYIGWVVAVVTGHIAIKQLKEGGDIERGRGMALTGLISGYSALGLTVILLLLALVAGVSIPVIEEIVRQLR